MAEGYEWNGRRSNQQTRPRHSNPSPNHAERNFALIMQDLERLETRGSRFDTELRRWQLQRMDTIAAVEGLKEKLETVGAVAEVARGAGSAAIIAGGFAALVGAIMEMNKAEGSDKWLEAGEGLKKFGEMTIPASTVIEMGVSEMFMNNVKNMLRQDRELSEPLNEMMQTSRSLDTRMRQTIGCGLDSTDLGDVLETFATSLNMMMSGKTSEAYRNAKASGSHSTFQKFAQMAEGLGEASIQNVLGLIERVSDFFADRPDTMRLCQSGFNLGSALLCGQSSRMELVPVMSAADMGFRSMGLSSGQRKCGLEAVRIAMEVVNLVSMAKDVGERRSHYCERLEELSSRLKNELDEVTSSARRIR